MTHADSFIQIVSSPPATGWGNPLAWGPLVALVGVIATNWWTGRNMRKAEMLRSSEALKAEGVRHQNALDRRTGDWLRETKTRTYSQLLLFDQRANNRLLDFIWDLDMTPSEDMSSLIKQAMVDIDGVLSEASEEISLIRSIGDLRIADVADQILTVTRRSSGEALEARRKEGYEPVSAQAKHHEARSQLLEQLTILIRADLLGSAPTHDESS